MAVQQENRAADAAGLQDGRLNAIRPTIITKRWIEAHTTRQKCVCLAASTLQKHELCDILLLEMFSVSVEVLSKEMTMTNELYLGAFSLSAELISHLTVEEEEA